MSTINKKSIIIISIVVALALIFGAWLIFTLISGKTSSTDNDSGAQNEAKVQKIRRLAEENLKFFPLSTDEKSILELLKENAQYEDLDVEIDTYINTKSNLGNPYPFAAPPAEDGQL